MLNDRQPVSLKATHEQLKKIQARLEEYQTALRLSGSELEQRSRDMITLTHFAYQSSHLSDLTTLLQLALMLALESIHTPVGAIILIDLDTRELTLGTEKGVTPELSQILTGKAWHEGAVALMPHLVTGAGALLECEADDEEAERQLLETGHLSSLVSLPLKAATQLVGAFLVGLQGQRRFKPSELCFLMALAQETAIAVDSLRLREGLWRTAETLLGSHRADIHWEKVSSVNLGLHTATSIELSNVPPAVPPSLEEDIEQALSSVIEAEHELQQQYADFESLNKITKLINRTLELEEILQAVVEETRPMLQADAAWIYLLDEKKQLEMRAHVGLSSAYVRGMRRLQQGDGLEGWVVSENRTRFVEAITSDSKTYKIWVDKEGLQTLVAAPITRPNQGERKGKTKPHVEGVLVAGRRAGHTRSWNMREVNLVSAIADHLAPTIHNTRVHAQIRENEANLAAGNQVLQEINEMLIKKNVLLEEFIHRDLGSALATTQSVLERLLEDESNTLADELSGDVANLRQLLNQLSRLAREIL